MAQILNKITIDGVTFDAHSTGVDVKLNNIGAVAANTKFYGDTVTITEKGVYGMYIQCLFGAAQTTGARKLDVTIEDMGGGPYCRQECVNGSNASFTLSGSIVRVIDNVPLTLRASGASSAGMSYGSSLSLLITKVLELGE